MAEAFLGLGSNLGNREANIREALDRLVEHPDISVKRVSSLYKTEPIGVIDQPDFINAAVLVETELSPLDLLREIMGIESQMGRIRNQHMGPRVIDIDLLLYDGVAMETPELTIPHPRMMERAFVLVPLAEIAPDLELPGGLSSSELLDRLGDEGVSKRRE